MLSVTCKAAIKAVIYIGSQKDANAKSSIKEIAQYIDENEHTVGKLLQKLVKKNIINSVKGPNGGFYITDKQKEKKIIVIVQAIDGEEVFNQCGLGLSKCSASFIYSCPRCRGGICARVLYWENRADRLTSHYASHINVSYFLTRKRSKARLSKTML